MDSVMKRKKQILSMAAALSTVLAFGSAPAAAQSYSHGIAAVVNDDIVTTHDLQQRVLFMMATTGAQRDEQTVARLQQTALRNGLDPNEVAQQLASVGVSINTLRDQVRSEIAWQRIVNGLYGSRIRISDAQIDENLTRISNNAEKPSVRVAEIYIEASPDIGGMEGAIEGGKAMKQQAEQGAPFALLAQQFSSAPSAAKGGDVGWVREGELRPEVDAALAAMSTGDVSDPITVPGGIYIVAKIEERISTSETVYKLKQVNVASENAEGIPAAMARLTALKPSLNDCKTLSDDIENEEDIRSADMGEVKSSELGEEIEAILADTTVNELSAPIETPAGAIALMVCDRSVTGSNIPTRTEIEERLMDQQLAQASKRHLRDLRRQATIMVR